MAEGTGSEPPLLSVELLEGLEALWRAEGAPVVDSLAPGLSRSQMDALTAPLGLKLPVEAQLWWGWHNGAAVAEDAPAVLAEVGPWMPYVSLANALHAYQVCREIAYDIDDPDYGPDELWSPSWLPIARLGSIACECAVEEGAPTPILDTDPQVNRATPARVVAHSFGEMVSWWIDAIECGAWRYDGVRMVWDRRPELLSPRRAASGLV